MNLSLDSFFKNFKIAKHRCVKCANYCSMFSSCHLKVHGISKVKRASDIALDQLAKESTMCDLRIKEKLLWDAIWHPEEILNKNGDCLFFRNAWWRFWV